MSKNNRKRVPIESVEEVDEATGSKQSCSRASNEVETSRNDDLLKLQCEAESLMPASGIGDYCTEKILLYMYKLDVSTWCYVKRRAKKDKLEGVRLTVDNTEINKFSDIVISRNDEFIHVNVNYTVSPFRDKFITYLDLFGKKSPYSLYNYFNSWVSYELNETSYQSSKVKYLVVFCNDKLQLSDDDKLVLCSSKYSYPFQFESVDIGQLPVLQDMLVTNTSCKFHKFANDDLTISEFCQRLSFSSSNQKKLKNKCLTSEFEEDLKKSFLAKIIILDNQPCRESFKKILIHEIEQYNKDYIQLQNKLIKYTSIAKKSTCDENFKLLISVLNDMFIHENISAVSTKSYSKNNVINILYKSKITYLINLDSAKNAIIRYEDFFPFNKNEKSKFALNDLYTFFRSEYRKSSNIKFFIIYTYSELNLTCNNKIRNNKFDQYYTLQLNNVDLTQRRYKVIKNCTALKESKLHEFAPEDYSSLSKLLSHPSSNEQDVDSEDEEYLKSLFFHCLIFATGKKYIEDITLQNEELPYSIDQLQEITLRWLEFQKHHTITPRMMRVLLKDIKNNRSSCEYFMNENVLDEWKLARSICQKSPHLVNEVFDFLINGKGKALVNNFKNAGLKLTSLKNVLTGTPKNKIYHAFETLHNFWFDGKGCRTKKLSLLRKNHMNLVTVFSIIKYSHVQAVEIIEDLYDLWFDHNGKKTKYLTSLERIGIDFLKLGSILSGTSSNARSAHESIYNFFFDEQDNKTKYITDFEKNNLRFHRIISITKNSGTFLQSFKELHDLWFDVEGNKTKYLLSLENHNIDLYHFIHILYGCHSNHAYIYKKLYNALFDKNGNATKNLENLKSAGIKFFSLSRLLYYSAKNVAVVFKNLCELWFDKDGKKTKYLVNFENHNINIDDICKLLEGRPKRSTELFRDLHDFFFDEKGEKKKFLTVFENYGITLKFLASMIQQSNIHAIKSLENLANLWFDENGNKSYYLKNLENNNIDLLLIMKTLSNSHRGCVDLFEALYKFFIDENGMSSFYSNTLKKHRINFEHFMLYIQGASKYATQSVKKIFDLFFDNEGNKTQLLSNFENKDVDLTFLSNIFVFCRGKGIKEFHDIFFVEGGQDSEILKSFEKKNVCLIEICNIFHKTGSRTPFYFKMLFDLWFDEDFKETRYLQDMERNGVTLVWLCQILKGARVYACDTFKAIHQLFIDKDGNANIILQKVLKYINLKKLQNIFPFARTTFSTHFPKLFYCWFDEKGEKTHSLQMMEKYYFDIKTICDILKSSGGYAVRFYNSLYKLLFDSEGNPSLYITNYLNNPEIIKVVSKIIRGTRAKIVTLLKGLYTLWFKPDGSKRKCLLTFENYGLNFVTLHRIFIGVSKSVNKPFMDLFKCMFLSLAKPIESFYLKSLLGVGFTLTDIIAVLGKSGPNAARNFMNLYHLFFNEQGQMTKYAEILIQNKVDIASFVRGLNVRNGNKLVDIFKTAYSLYYDENGVKIDQVDNKEKVSNTVDG